MKYFNHYCLLFAIFLLTGLVWLPHLNSPLDFELLDNDVFPLKYNLIDNLPRWIMADFSPIFFRPVQAAVVFLSVEICGRHAWGYRLINWSLLLTALLALYAFSRLLMKDRYWALLPVALVALHPSLLSSIIEVEAVNESLSLLFLMAALWAWGKFLLVPRGGWGWLVLCCLAFILGSLSKERVLMLPLLMALLQATFWLKKEPFRKDAAVKAGYLAILILAAVYWVVRFQVLGGLGGYTGEGHLIPTAQILRNLQKTVGVAVLAESGRVHLREAINLRWLIIHLLIAVMLILGFRLRPRGSQGWNAAFGFAMMFVVAAPALNFKWVAIRFVFMPSVGLFIGLAALFQEWYGKIPKLRYALAALGAVMIVSFLFSTQKSLADILQRREADRSWYTVVRDQYLPPEKTTLHVWNESEGRILCFASCNHPEASGFLRDTSRKVIAVEDNGRGGDLICFELWKPFQEHLGSADQYFKLDLTGGAPNLVPLDQVTYLASIPEPIQYVIE